MTAWTGRRPRPWPPSWRRCRTRLRSKSTGGVSAPSRPPGRGGTDTTPAIRAGYVRAVEEIKAVEHQLVDALGGIDLPQVMARRWHVCCAACQRRGRHQSGCDRCEDRTRATFGQPHPDDYPGRQA